MTDRTRTPDQAPRSRYEKPKLLIFGDASELTLNVGTMGADDGAITGAMKTSV